MNPLHDPTLLPANLPVPRDDGGCLHLRGRALPAVRLPSTCGGAIDLGTLPTPAVIFAYPRTGVPGQPPGRGFSDEDWDSIPGARGCTPQACGYRDLHADFASLGYRVFGLSTNTPEHQREFGARMHIPFAFLSDQALALTRALALPTFEFPVEHGGPSTLLKRAAIAIHPDHAGVPRIARVWYPVFPPQGNARAVLDWTQRRQRIRIEPISATNAEFVRGELTRHWVSTTIRSRGVAFEAERLPGFVAWVGDHPAGHVTLSIRGRECEVITLSAVRDDGGVGSALLDAAEDAARARACTRLFLTTTNDNLRALAFYQRRGMRLAALYPGEADRSRDHEPGLPRVAPGGIPIRDELELEFDLRGVPA